MLAKLFGPRPTCPLVNSTIDLSSFDDGLDRLRKTAADVTLAATGAAKLLEEEHQRTKACFLALNAASDSIVILDKDGCIFFCNDQFLSWRSIHSYRDVIGTHILELLPNIPNFAGLWQAVRNNRSETVNCPSSNISLTVVPMMNGEPNPIYYVCTFKDKNKNS